MSRLIPAVLCAGACWLAAAVPTHAAIIFDPSPSFVQPDENLLYNADGIFTGPGTTIQGATNQTGTVFNLTGQVDLIAPSGGQARVEDEAQAGFNSLLIDALLSDVFYTEFEANLNADADGMAFITATDSTGQNWSFSYDLDAGGENFFGLIATDGTLIDTVLITTDAALQDVRQIRIGGLSSGAPGPGPDPVPEPTTLALLGIALLGSRALARRR